MKKLTLLAVAVSALLSGCVAPGSSIGRIGLKAHCESKDPAPKELRAVLTKEYGLGGLDRYFGKPEDYGHSDIEKVASLVDGRYSIEFPRVVYHIDFWMLPPLGARPKRPPPPIYWIQISDSPDEVYLLGFDKNEFRYRVFDRISRQEKKTTEARWRLADGRYTPEPTADGSRIWFLEFTMTEPNQAPEPTTMAVTLRAPSRTKRASHGRGSS